LDRLIATAARRHGLSPGLVKAVALAESGLDPTAVSPAGAQGLMQLMPATAQELGLTEPFDPAQNLDAGCRYLKRLLTKYEGNLKTALAAYNWGQGNLVRRGRKALPPETRSFVGRVLRTQDRLAKGLPA
jgi:soluble lytic murein transglycosylase-like protein